MLVLLFGHLAAVGRAAALALARVLALAAVVTGLAAALALAAVLAFTSMLVLIGSKQGCRRQRGGAELRLVVAGYGGVDGSSGATKQPGDSSAQHHCLEGILHNDLLGWGRAISALFAPLDTRREKG